jgi:hypothetical protein
MRTIDLFVHQLAFTQFVLLNNAKGVSHEESLIEPQPGGNCMNWIVGHILVARNQLLGLLGREAIWDDAIGARYKRGGDPIHEDGAGVRRFESLLQDLELTYERIRPSLASCDEGRMGEKAPFSPTNNPNETWGTLLAGLLFHEAYHAGQTGVLRRIVGKNEGNIT